MTDVYEARYKENESTPVKAFRGDYDAMVSFLNETGVLPLLECGPALVLDEENMTLSVVGKHRWCLIVRMVG